MLVHLRAVYKSFKHGRVGKKDRVDVGVGSVPGRWKNFHYLIDRLRYIKIQLGSSEA